MPLLEVDIERLSISGDGVAQHEGRAVFVEGAAPGERVRIELDPSGRVLRGALVEVLTPSPQRRAPPCPYASACGGCGWMHLEEALQLEAKQAIVVSALERQGGVDADAYALLPAYAAAPPVSGRRRAALHPGPEGLGFHGKRSHTLVAVDRCLALTPGLADLPAILTQALGPALKDVEELRLLEAGGRVAASIHLKGALREKLKAACEGLVRAGTLAGAVLLPAEGKGAAQTLGEVELDDHGALLRPDGFAQASDSGNQALIAHAVGALGLTGQQGVLELYSGNGNFTFALAQHARSVVAVESSALSVRLAQKAALKRGAANVRFVQGDAAKVALGLRQEVQPFDCLLLDPPRSGAPGVGEWASRLLVQKVVYVACDPASLARDTKELVATGFVPTSLKVFDLFPQTHHVESVLVLERPRP